MHHTGLPWPFARLAISCDHRTISTVCITTIYCAHETLTRYVKLLVAHAPGMPGTISPPPTSMEIASNRFWYASCFLRDARAVMLVGIANPRWQGIRSRLSRRMNNPPIYVSGKRPMRRRYDIKNNTYNTQTAHTLVDKLINKAGLAVALLRTMVYKIN